MNQHDQMREALRKLKSEEKVRTFAEAQYWLNQYRIFAERLLAAEPAPLVRLTFDEVIAIFRRPGIQEWGVALAIMDAMERKNEVCVTEKVAQAKDINEQLLAALLKSMYAHHHPSEKSIRSALVSSDSAIKNAMKWKNGGAA